MYGHVALIQHPQNIHTDLCIQEIHQQNAKFFSELENNNEKNATPLFYLDIKVIKLLFQEFRLTFYVMTQVNLLMCVLSPSTDNS